MAVRLGVVTERPEEEEHRDGQSPQVLATVKALPGDRGHYAVGRAIVHIVGDGEDGERRGGQLHRLLVGDGAEGTEESGQGEEEGGLQDGRRELHPGAAPELERTEHDDTEGAA